MKKLLLSLSVIALLAACGKKEEVAAPAAPAPAPVAAAPAELKVAIDPTYEPFTFKTADGQPTGFDVDIANALSISGKEAEDFLSKALDIAEDQVEDEADAAGETLTQAQIDELVNAILQEKVLNPMKEQEEEQFAGQVRTRIDGVFDKHAIPAEDRQFLVAAAGDALPDETRDLDAIEAAVEKAIEAYDARIEERVQSHLKAKKETAAASPTVLKGGGSGAGDGTAAKEEPRSIKDVIRARREGKVKVGQ